MALEQGTIFHIALFQSSTRHWQSSTSAAVKPQGLSTSLVQGRRETRSSFHLVDSLIDQNLQSIV